MQETRLQFAGFPKKEEKMNILNFILREYNIISSIYPYANSTLTIRYRLNSLIDAQISFLNHLIILQGFSLVLKDNFTGLNHIATVGNLQSHQSVLLY